MTDTARLKAAIADRYRIERELGAGGMATVYLAADLKHDRKVAVKVLKPELAAVIGAERFVVEIKTTAALQHPHILPLFDSGNSDGFLYYVMPYIEGETLRAKLDRETQFGVDEAVRITTQVADALDYAHRHGVIHRDIKPENILLHDGRPMVADFGIALALSAAAGGRMTETGMSLGTPHYMSPEQATADKEITGRSDIYSLASMLYEMLTGNPPHTGATAQQIIMKIIAEPVQPVTAYRKSVPANVASALARALEKLPADRFANAAEFAAALADRGFTVATAAAIAAAKGPRWRVAALAPWLVAGLALGVAAFGWLRTEPRPVEWRRVVIWRWPAPAGSVGSSMAISPDDRTIVYRDTTGGTPRLWAKDRDRLLPTMITGTEEPIGPIFSPDGEWIAFVSAGKVKKVSRRGGAAVTLSDSAFAGRPALGWLDDGTIVFNAIGSRLMAVHQDGGPIRQIWASDSNQPRLVATIAPIPGSKALLFGSCSAGCQVADIRVLDLATGEAKVLADGAFAVWYVRGDQVVFTRKDGGALIAPFDLGTLTFSAPPTPVLEGVRTTLGRVDMQVSRGGKLIYISGGAMSNAQSEAVWVSRKGEATRVDTGWTFSPSGNFGLDLSPDGRSLAISILASGSEDIWVKQLDRGPLTRITFDGINVRPAWTRDGRTVMYSAAKSGRGNEDLRAHRADGTGGESVLLDHARGLWEVEPTRDPSLLIVRLGVPATRDIFLARLGGDSAVVTPLIASGQYEETSIALSPDGRWLAYVSTESSRAEVYVRPFPDVDAGRWQISRNGGGEPRWSHSGRELFFRDAAGMLISTTVVPGPTFVTAEQRPLFLASGYASSTANAAWAVAPGDQRFLFVRSLPDPSGAETTSLIEADHWVEGLRRAPGASER
jgi:Tol biopolymer transport system component